MKNDLKSRQFYIFLGIVFINTCVDLGQKMTLLNLINTAFSGPLQVALTAVVQILIVLPALLFMTPSGFLADRFAKSRVTQWTIASTVPLALLSWMSYAQGWFWASMGLMLAFAIQSVFYAPVRNSHIKELVGAENLGKANAAVQALTVTATLLGAIGYSALYGALIQVETGDAAVLLTQLTPVAWIIVGLTVLQTCLSIGLKQGGEGHRVSFDWGAYARMAYLKQTLSKVWNNEVIWLSSVGLGIFFGVNQVLLSLFAEHIEAVTGITDAVTIQSLPALAGIGVIVGALYSGRVSKHYIETGVLPIGAIGATCALAVMPFLSHIWAFGGAIFIFGICCGLYIVPLMSLIQFGAGDDDIGKISAADGFIQNAIMSVFLVAAIGLSSLAIPVSTMLYGLAVIGLFGTLYLVLKIPQFFVRFLLRFFAGTRYKLTVNGIENIPATGPVLLLGNHVSYLDWAILQISCPRQIRFVMARNIYSKWYLKWFLDLMHVIPISSASSKDSLRAIEAALNAGDVVALFPEGHLSRTGQLAAFHKGFEIACRMTAAVVVPFYLKGLWGSEYSFATRRFKENLRSLGPRRVYVEFGKGLPSTVTGSEVKQQIIGLSVSAWQSYTATLGTISREWLKVAKRIPGKLAVADSSGIELTHRELFVAVNHLKKHLLSQTASKNIGIVLPAGVAGVVGNLSVLMAGKTVVNLNFTASPESLRMAVKKAKIDTVLTSRRMVSKLEDRGMGISDLLAGVHVIWIEDILKSLTVAKKIIALLSFVLMPVAWLNRHSKNDIERVAAILFSSGSEGVPKGVLLTHRNIVGNIKQTTTVINPTDADVMVSSLPLFHAFGLTVTTFLPLLEGIPVVAHPDPTDGFAIGKLTATYQGTILFGTSTFFRLYIRNQKLLPIMFQSLRLVLAGAERLSAAVRIAFKEKFGLDILEGYGTTETTPVVTVNIPDVLDTDLWWVHVGNKPGTVGLPLPGSAIRIVDPETFSPVPFGESGLILIGGTQLMQGYLEDAEKTASVISIMDGIRWYHTGDKGRLDVDGFLIIEDRFARFAKIGGEMISLTAVETAIEPLIQGSENEIMLVAIPDEKKGEAIILLLSGPLSATELASAIAGSDLIPLWRPDKIIHVDALPKLGSGKLDFVTAKTYAMS
jgi:acyl-[acyl-carrier-protein]-phospholipid O-acyltransferase/long-chain-fatty-acid--[acyl-carrier-protein] ligase